MAEPLHPVTEETAEQSTADLEPRLQALDLEVQRVGDCRRPGRTPEAMLDAARLAYRL